MRITSVEEFLRKYVNDIVGAKEEINKAIEYKRIVIKLGFNMLCVMMMEEIF